MINKIQDITIQRFGFEHPMTIIVFHITAIFQK